MKLFKNKIDFLQFSMKLSATEVFDFYVSKRDEFLSKENEDTLLLLHTKIKGFVTDNNYNAFCNDIITKKPRFSNLIYEKIFEKNKKISKGFFSTLVDSKEYDLLFSILKNGDYLFLEKLNSDKFKSIPEKYLLDYFCNEKTQILSSKHNNMIGRIVDSCGYGKTHDADSHAINLVLMLKEKNISIQNENLIQFLILEGTRKYLLENKEMLKSILDDSNWESKYDFFTKYRYYDDFLEKTDGATFSINDLKNHIRKTISFSYMNLVTNKSLNSEGILENKRRAKI